MRMLTILTATALLVSLGCGQEPQADSSKSNQQAKAGSGGNTGGGDKGPGPGAGKRKRIDDDEPEKRQPPQSGVARRMEIPQITGLLKQIGLAYHTYMDANRKAPQKAEDLLPFVENNKKVIEPLKNGHVTFIYGATIQSMTEGTSNTLIAYETDADQSGIRVVLFGDGSVRTMNDAEFKKTPKAKGK